jgi:hypothetical protein
MTDTRTYRDSREQTEAAPDESCSCGIQPANIRMIIAAFPRPTPLLHPNGKETENEKRI